MNPLELLFGQIANTVRQHSSPNTPGPSYDANPLLGALGGLFGQYANQNGQQFGGYQQDHDYSQYGGFDPGQLFGGQHIPSSDQDPYGDPGLQGGGGGGLAGMFGGNVRSSDEDPYGDPGAR